MALYMVSEVHPVITSQEAAQNAHEDFGQIVDLDGTVLLCLHQWEAHGHFTLRSPEQAKPGNGLILFFRVDDFDATLTNARSLATQLAEERI
jgi:hypothetical protein